ncbi:unnamed protein product [Calypogeia fissa]
MAGSGPPPHIPLFSPTSRPFSATPVARDVYEERPRHSGSGPRFDGSPHAPSSSQRPENVGSSNFMNVLRDRVQAVLDAQQSSSSRPSSVGSVSHPTTTTTDLPPHSQSTAHIPHAPPVGPYTHPVPQPPVQMLPFQTGSEPVVYDYGPESGVRPASLDDYYSIDWRPKELFLKFRQQVEGYQLGVNFEFDGFQATECNPKLVFKPAKVERKWKFIFEPKRGDLRLLTKKIPIGPILNIQVGIGHEWQTHTTGWKWKVTSALGGAGPTTIRKKTLFPLTPAFDIRVGWNADYVLPDLHGALGTGDPAIGLNLGHLYASIERLEAIYTHRT